MDPQGLTGNSVTEPDSMEDSHYLLAYNSIYVDLGDPGNPIFDIVPLRESEIHLNILKLLEGGPCFNCFKLVGFSFPEPGTLNINIEIDHPIPDLQFSVFDCRGIMMFRGSHSFPVTGKTISDSSLGDGSILNADGYTALFNGSTVDAPVGTFQKYFTGVLGTLTAPNSDINAFKYYTTDAAGNNRNAFFGGSSDTQTFSMKVPTGPFILGYAVDANWWPPIQTPVDDPLTDFDLNANCPEPWQVVVAEEPIGGGLSSDGGQTKLNIDVFDWQGKSTFHAPKVECPELFDGQTTSTWVSDGTGFSRYEAVVSNANLASGGIYKCLVSVEANENDPVNKPWMDLTAYQIVNLAVQSGGNLVWAKRDGASSFDKGFGVTTLSDDSTVVTGMFFGTVTFGPGDPHETSLTAAGFWDIFVARYNADGTIAWAKRAGSVNDDRGLAVTALSDDTVIVTGMFKATAIFGKDEAHQTSLVSAGDYDLFVAHYNTDGTLAWAKRAGGDTGDDQGLKIARLSDDSVIVTGMFKMGAIFGAGEPNETSLTSGGFKDVFIARYNTNGTLAWAKRAGGASDYDRGYGITALTDDTVIVTGTFAEAATFGPGEPGQVILNSAGNSDVFIAHYNSNGTLAWVKRAGGATSFDWSYDIVALSDNTTVLIGYFYSTATFGPGEPGQTILTSTSADTNDIFIAHYNTNGTLDWAKQAGGSSNEYGYGITALSDDSTVVTGLFSTTATFGSGDPNQTILTSDGDLDLFIARYNTDGTLNWAKRAGGITNNANERSYSITALSDDSAVLTGVFDKTATFGFGELNETALTSAGSTDILVARFAP